MTSQEIITAFELQVGDLTELSTVEELMILNRVYQHICSDRPWIFLRNNFTAVQDTTVPYIALPDDFGYVLSNYDYATNDWYGSGAYVLVGSTNDPYSIIPYGDRNRYVNDNSRAYIDEINNRLVFTGQPTAANTISIDYIAEPADLALTDTPLIPKRFQPMLIYGMAVEDYILQISDSTAAFQQNNQTKYQDYFARMASWNARASGLL